MSLRRFTASRGTAVSVTAIALVGVLGLTACNSQPGHRRVVQDMIDSLELPADEDQCMRDVLGEYSNDELEQIADENDGLNFAQEQAAASGTDQYQEYVASLTRCTDGGATESTESASSTDPGASTEVTDTSDAAEANETTEASETT